MTPGLLGEGKDLVKFFDLGGAVEIPVGSGGHSETGDVGESVKGKVHRELYLEFAENGRRYAFDDEEGDPVGEFEVVLARTIFEIDDFCGGIFDGHSAFHALSHFGFGGARFDRYHFNALFDKAVPERFEICVEKGLA